MRGSRINPTLYKAEIQGHRMIADADDPKERRSYAASRHYDDYAIADAHGNRDGRQGLRLGLPGVEILEVFRAPVNSALNKPPTKGTPMPSTKPTHTAPNATPAKRAAKQGKSLKPSPASKAQRWQVSAAAHAALSRSWKGSTDEPQARVLERVLAFAQAARELARQLDFTPEQMTSETLLDALSVRYRALSEQAQQATTGLEAVENQQRTQKEADQQKQRKLERHLEELTAERDALSARLIGLQRQLKEAVTHSGPHIELLPIAHQLLGLSSRASSLAPTQLQEALMRLAMDAIAQAAGPSSSARAPAPANLAPTPPRTDPVPAPREPITPGPPAEPEVAAKSASGQPGPAPEVQSTPPSGIVPGTAAETDERPDREPPSPPAPKVTVNRHTSQADEKLSKAFRYLTDLNEAAEVRGQKWFISESLLADLTGCFRPAVKRFVAAHRDQIDNLNRRHGLGSGHNRGRSRMQPSALPELIKTFKDSVLNLGGVEQPF